MTTKLRCPYLAAMVEHIGNAAAEIDARFDDLPAPARARMLQHRVGVHMVYVIDAQAQREGMTPAECIAVLDQLVHDRLEAERGAAGSTRLQ